MTHSVMEIFISLEKNTIIHRLDPRSKGFGVIVISILGILFSSLLLQVFLFIFLIPIILTSKTSKSIFGGIKELILLFIMILLINSYFISINSAVIIIFRIINLLITISLYFQTTNPDKLMQSLTSIRVPYNLAFSFSLSFRFIPTLARELFVIQDAQKSRGHRIEEGNLIRKLLNWFPIIIPLLINSIYRAFHVAEALETRGFGTSKNVTEYFPLKLKKSDFAILTISILFLSLGIIIKFLPNLFPDFIYWNLSF